MSNSPMFSKAGEALDVQRQAMVKRQRIERVRLVKKQQARQIAEKAKAQICPPSSWFEGYMAKDHRQLLQDCSTKRALKPNNAACVTVRKAKALSNAIWMNAGIYNARSNRFAGDTVPTSMNFIRTSSPIWT